MLYWSGIQPQFAIKYLATQVILQADEEYVELFGRLDGQPLRQAPPLDLSKNWYYKNY